MLVIEVLHIVVVFQKLETFFIETPVTRIHLIIIKERKYSMLVRNKAAVSKSRWNEEKVATRKKVDRNKLAVIMTKVDRGQNNSEDKSR